jgi:hypothetical protein
MMVEDLRYDPYLQAVAAMTNYEPDMLCAERIRERCHARFGRRKREGITFRATSRYFRRFLEPSLVAVSCAVFLCEVLRRALQLYGL